jgi:hypothetical protein
MIHEMVLIVGPFCWADLELLCPCTVLPRKNVRLKSVPVTDEFETGRDVNPSLHQLLGLRCIRS